MELKMVSVLVAVIVCLLGRRVASQTCDQSEIMKCAQPAFMKSGPLGTGEVACGDIDEAKACIEALYERCDPEPKMIATGVMSQLVQMGGRRCLGDYGGTTFTSCATVIECGMALTYAAQDFAWSPGKVNGVCRRLLPAISCLKTGETQCEPQRDILNTFIQTSSQFEGMCKAILTGCSTIDVVACFRPVQHLMTAGKPTEEITKQNCGPLTKAMDCVFETLEGCTDAQAKAKLEGEMQYILSFKTDLEMHCDYKKKTIV